MATTACLGIDCSRDHTPPPPAPTSHAAVRFLVGQLADGYVTSVTRLRFHCDVKRSEARSGGVVLDKVYLLNEMFKTSSCDFAHNNNSDPAAALQFSTVYAIIRSLREEN